MLPPAMSAAQTTTACESDTNTPLRAMKRCEGRCGLLTDDHRLRNGQRMGLRKPHPVHAAGQHSKGATLNRQAATMRGHVTAGREAAANDPASAGRVGGEGKGHRRTGARNTRPHHRQARGRAQRNAPAKQRRRRRRRNNRIQPAASLTPGGGQFKPENENLTAGEGVFFGAERPEVILVEFLADVYTEYLTLPESPVFQYRTR